MRSLQLQVRADHVPRIFVLAAEHDALAPLAVRAELAGTAPADAAGEAADAAGGDGAGDVTGAAWSLVLLDLPNERVGAFVDAVRREIDDARFVLFPVGTLPLETPVDNVAPRVRDVSRLSTLELVLASLQSVGAWKGMLLYSALAGTIGAYGLIFDVSYLLVAAMLINPMGAPALVAVIGLAIGDATMFGRGGARFLASLAVQAAAALLLGFAYDIQVSTAMMEQVASLSTWAVLVAVAAGAAGAVTQIKSDRDSLVSGTAAGFMVAAALAPPAAVLGLSVPLGRWDYFGLMAFLLGLQFFAIAAGGWLALFGFGVAPADASIGRGSARARNTLLAAVGIMTIGLVAWQTAQPPRMQKADLSRTALEIARDAVDAAPGASLIEARARFTRPALQRYAQEALLIEITAERNDSDADDASLQAEIRGRVQTMVTRRMRGVVPFVDITLLPGPGALR